jgi:hypothetical protein
VTHSYGRETTTNELLEGADLSAARSEELVGERFALA